MAWGLTETPASLYQILMALIPLATIFLSALQGLESITARSIFGTLLAIVGIIIVVGGSGATQISTWMAFIFLVLFVTVIAFLLYMFVLGKWSASRTSYGFVLTPLVTVLVASVFTNEVITMNFVLGAVFVLTGVYVGALMNGKKVVAQEECKDRSGQTLPRCV